jgi:replicative DNA helicase
MNMSEYDDGDLGLSDEEAKLLKTLSDPDNVSKEKFIWDQDAQREILSLLLHDKTFLIQSVDLIKPGYFTNESHQLISRILFNYFKKYKGSPSKIQLIQEISSICSAKDSKVKVGHVGELSAVYEYFMPATGTREYYLDKITNFAKAMTMKMVFSQCMEEAEQAPEEETTWIKISNLLRSALDIERNFDVGLDYFNSFEERYERAKVKREENEIFVTGFKDIDDSLGSGGLSRGEIGSIVGLSGSGKSLFLVKAGLENLNLGHKVLYISLEIDQDKVAERFDAQFVNPHPFGDAHNGVTVKNLLDNEDKVFEALREYISDKENKQLMIVKQFPAGDMDLGKMRAYYSQLGVSGFTPDLLIIDYVGEMRDFPDMATWESRQRIVRDLRGFAVEEQICILTAMQPGKVAKQAITLGGIIDDDMLADSYGQIRPLDALWSLNQHPTEKECGLARIFVIKHRFGKSRFIIYIQIDPDTLRMRQISEARYKTIKMTYENTKTVTAADALKLDEESKTKVANFVRAASENKRKKNPETDAYNILDNTSEPDVPIKSKFSDVGYGSEDVDYQDTN